MHVRIHADALHVMIIVYFNSILSCVSRLNRQISWINRTKSRKLNASRLVLQLSLPKSTEVRC